MFHSISGGSGGEADDPILAYEKSQECRNMRKENTDDINVSYHSQLSSYDIMWYMMRLKKSKQKK